METLRFRRLMIPFWEAGGALALEIAGPNQPRYCSSLTFSIQSTTLPSSAS